MTASDALVWEEETRRAYRQVGIGERLVPGRRPVVLVVDLSRGFTDPLCPLGADLTAVVAATRRILDQARRAGHPRIFTTVAFAPDGVEGAVWRRKMPALAHLTEGSPWVGLDAHLGRTEDEPLIIKRAASALAGTGLAAMLASFAADTVVVCGATTSGCIRATVTDLCELGYPTLVPRECVGDRAPGPHLANLFDMDAKYADVLGLDAALDVLAQPREPVAWTSA